LKQLAETGRQKARIILHDPHGVQDDPDLRAGGRGGCTVGEVIPTGHPPA